MLSSLGQACGVLPNISQVSPSVVKEHILSAQSTGDTKRWELLGMPSGFGQQAHISAEQRSRLLQRVQEVFELRSRFSAQGSFVFRMAEVVISALAAVIHLNSGPEFHGEALACGRRACMEAESMGRWGVSCASCVSFAVVVNCKMKSKLNTTCFICNLKYSAVSSCSCDLTSPAPFCFSASFSFG